MFLCWILICNLCFSLIGIQAQTGSIQVDHHNHRWRIGFSTEFHDRYLETTKPVTSIRLSNYSVNGVNAYCIEPNVELYASFDPVIHEEQDALSIMEQAGYTQAEIEEIQQIAALGYGFQGDTSEEMNAATQVRIWQVHFKDVISNIPSEIQNKIDRINERLRIFKTPISFENQTIELTKTGKENAIVLTDSNGVLGSSFLNEVPEGFHVEQEGNTCRIWADEGVDREATITWDILYRQNEANGKLYAYSHQYNQTLASFGKPRPRVAKIQLRYKEPKGKIHLIKIGEQLKSMKRVEREDTVHTEFIYENKPIKNIEFEIIPKEDIRRGNEIIYKKGEIIETITTDETGKANTSLLPYGTYIVREVKAAEGFINNPKEFEIVMDEQGAHVKEHTIENQRRKVKFNIQKISNATKKPMKDCAFGIYTKEDIVLGDSKLPANTLLETAISNEKGEVPFSIDLPFGTYWIQEISCPDAYEISNEKFVIDMNTMDEMQDVLNVEHTFKNDFKKVGFQIQKVDENDKLIQDKAFEFGLYKDKECKEEIILASGTNGIVSFKDLEIGTYYVKETKAPEGYHISKYVLKVDVKEDGTIHINDMEMDKVQDVYTVKVKNKKIFKLQTGLNTNHKFWLGLCVFSIIGIVLFKIKKMKKA